MALLVTVIALCLAAATGASSVGRLSLSAAMAWLLVELALRTRLAPWLVRWAREERALLALVAILPMVVLWSRATTLLEGEGLLELAPRLSDRARLASGVTVAPPLVVAGRAQTFFVRAEGAGSVRVAFEGEEALEASSLGHGVFRVDARPRGVARARDEITATITVDGAVHSRSLAHVAPLAHPRGLRIGTDHVLCAVSAESSEVHVGTLGAMRTMPASEPAACALTSDAFLVARRDETTLGRVPRAELATSEGLAAGPEIGRGAVAMDARGELVAIVRSAERRELVVLDAGAGRVLARAPLEGIPLHVSFAGDRVLVATRSPARLELFALDASHLASRDLVMPATAVVASAETVVIATTAFDEVVRENLGNHFVEDQLVWLDPRTLSPTRVEPTARRTERQDHAGDADRGLGPAALALDDEGQLFVAFVSSSEVARYAPGAPTRHVDLGETLFGPSGLAIDGESVIVSSATDGVIASLDRRSLALVREERVAPTHAELLRTTPTALQIRLGERTFFEGTRAGASCHSCHLGGSTDGEAHNIGGRVLAPTLDVRGLRGTAPYLRDGSYPHLGDLHEVAVLEYRGYRAPLGDRRTTLDAYLASLPVPTSLAPRDVVREQRGVEAFFRAGCDRCHAPPAFTTLARYPLHTVFPDVEDDPALSLDVPSLRNLHEQAPYLYDGRAATLLDVLVRANASNRHGDTRVLSEAERADLVFFLETL
jgi:hypothetical protein